MNSENALKTDKFDFIYRNHVVAFIDLLGQKEHVKRLEGILQNPLDSTKEQLLLETLRATVGFIRNFRDLFTQNFVEELERNIPSDVPAGLREQFEQLRSRSKINFQSFSDSTILWTPVEVKAEIDYAQVLNSIHAILAAIAMMTPIALSLRSPFRGGIDLEGAIAITPGGNEIYGPALNRAYELESRIADYPRVIVGKGISTLFDKVSGTDFQDRWIGDYCRLMVNRCKEWLVIDDDGYPMVHFLGSSFTDVIKEIDGIDFFKFQLTEIENFLNVALVTFKNDPHLSSKYQKLRTYFRKYRPQIQ